LHGVASEARCLAAAMLRVDRTLDSWRYGRLRR
jgi:hypothetical protein